MSQPGEPQPRSAIEPMLSIAQFAEALLVSRRTLERMLSAGKVPRPDLRAGRMPRWKPETVRRWIDSQARGRGVGR